jgi:SAM-dependent methyltransferase
MLDMLTEFGDVVGLDASSVAVGYCRERFGDGLELRLGRIPEDVPAGADLITAFDVVEHLEDDAGALLGLHERLRPGGLFVCTVPAFPFLWSEHDVVHHHHRRYTRAGLRGRLVAAGFEVERLSYFNSLLFPVAAAVRTAHRFGPARSRGNDATRLPRIGNRFLLRLFASERHLLRHTQLPFGISLLAVCRRSGQPAAAQPSAA